MEATATVATATTATTATTVATVKGGGALYEEAVATVVAAATATSNPHLSVLPRSNTSSSRGIDLPLLFYGSPLSVELKKKGAQMSGTSAYYDRATSTFTGLAKSMSDADLILAAAQAKAAALDAYLDAAKELEPTSTTLRGVPFSILRTTRTALKERGLQAAAASEFVHPIAFLREFHNKKGIYYIQIEDVGFFWLGQNPFQFPIPELEGTFKLECRIGFAGSAGRDVVTAGYRIQGRLHASNTSPWSLDKPDHCAHLFGHDWR